MTCVGQAVQEILKYWNIYKFYFQSSLHSLAQEAMKK